MYINKSYQQREYNEYVFKSTGGVQRATEDNKKIDCYVVKDKKY